MKDDASVRALDVDGRNALRGAAIAMVGRAHALMAAVEAELSRNDLADLVSLCHEAMGVIACANDGVQYEEEA